MVRTDSDSESIHKVAPRIASIVNGNPRMRYLYFRRDYAQENSTPKCPMCKIENMKIQNYRRTSRFSEKAIALTDGPGKQDDTLGNVESQTNRSRAGKSESV